jgi:BMFP domain-containing protein YqiC
MDTRSKIFDDLSKLMTNAMGVAQGARTEAENAFRGMIDRWLAEQDLVTREDFDAVRAMALKAREENAALEARITALESAMSAAAAPKPATPRATRKPKPKADL